MGKNQYTKFEEQLRQNLRSYQAPYNPADWADMEKRLDALQPSAGKRFNNNLKWGAAGLAAAVGAFLLILNLTPEKTVNKENNTIVAEQQIAAPAALQAKAEGGKIETGMQDDALAISTNEAETATMQHEQKTQSANPANTAEEAEVKKETANTQQEKETTPGKNETTTEVNNEVKLNADFNITSQTLCAGQKINMAPEVQNLEQEYAWNFGNGTKSSQMLAGQSFEAGTYTITLTVKSPRQGKSKTSTKMITIHANPEAGFDFDEGAKGNILFTDISYDATEWIWNFGDGQTSKAQHPQHTFAKGSYNVSLLVKNVHGCTAKANTHIIIRDQFNVFFPNSFTPNGDGKNDTWTWNLGESAGDIVEFNLQIVDPKTGSIVFSTTDKNDQWDGMVRGNGPAGLGQIYGWVVRMRLQNGSIYEDGGTITVVK